MTDYQLPQSRADWEITGTTKITDKQIKMLNAVCGDLAKQVRFWHGDRFDKDDWRHFFSGVAKGFRTVPGWDNGDGRRGFVMLGASSLTLTKSEAADAITMGLSVGDDPSSQGLSAPRVRWCDAVLRGLGFNPADFRDSA